MSVTREKIRLSSDSPTIVTLEEADGHETRSQITGATEYRYSVLCQGTPGFLYLPAAARQELLRQAAQPGDQVRILKQVHGREATYSIQLLREPSRLRGHYPVGATTQNGHLRPVPPRPSLAAAETRPLRGSSHLAQCLCAAIDAAIEAAEYARSKNFSVTFLGSDIRAIANSLYINDQNGAQQ